MNHGRRYRYYVERSLLTAQAVKGKSAKGQVDETGNGFQAKVGWRVPAHQIEQLVLNQVAAFLRDRGALLDAIRSERKSPDVVSTLFARGSKLADGCEAGSIASHLKIVTSLVRRITVAEKQVTIEIDCKNLVERFADQKAPPSSKWKDHRPILIEVPVRFQRRGVEAKLVVLGRKQRASEHDAKLIKALARAHDWFSKIVLGNANGPANIAKSERLRRTHVTRVLCLAFLAPEMTKAILEGRQPTELTAKKLICSALRIPLLWNDQHTALGVPFEQFS